ALALLPVYARGQLHGGPSTYGLLLGCIGAGAILGAFVRTRMHDLLRTPVLVPSGMAGLSAALFLLGRTSSLPTAGACLAVFGFGVLVVLSRTNASVQLAR